MSLDVDNLKVYYRTLHGDVHAVDDVTFGIADGEIMGLAGESGCGKSSLGNSLVYLAGRMRYVSGASTRRDPLPIWDFEQDEPASLQAHLGHPAIRDERTQPDPQGRDADRGAPAIPRRAVRSVEGELLRRLDLVGLPTTC